MADQELEQIARGRLGRVLKGKYRLDRVLGIGGMAVVYAATHRNKKKFAIKMLHPELSMRENIRTRFLREGYVANSVEHPGAVAVLDDDVAEDGSAFVVMELLDGAPVDEVSARHGGRVPLAVVLSIGDALLDVLVAAHLKGVIHRDIKPANIFLTSDGRLEVLDFGIARLHDETSGSATQTGAMLGTPAYMAPEQALAESSKVDAQTDLWAVGATLFTLLTGELVHPGENASQLLVNAATKKARSVGSLAADVPKPIVDVIDRALAFDKGQRWASAKEMREALQKACLEATGAPIAALPRTERSAESVTGLEATVASSEQISGAKSGVGFEATVDAKSGAGTPAQTTGAAVATTKASVIPPRARAMPWRAVAIGSAVCALLATGAFGYRAARAPKIIYCLDVDFGSDGPRCSFEVGPEAARLRREPTPRVTLRSGRVALVEYVNFAGVADARDDGVAKIEVARDDAGAVQAVKTYDRSGLDLQWQKWSDGGRRIDFVDFDGETPRRMNGDGRVTRLLVDYDARGRRTRVTFFGPTGRPRTDHDESEQDVYGIAFEYGVKGDYPIKRTHLGSDGLPAPDSLGVVVARREDNGFPMGGDSYFGADERPVARNGEGSHSWRLGHDQYQQTSWAFFGLHDEPVTSLVETIHEGRIAWDPVKRVAQWTSFDEHERPTRVRGWWSSSNRLTFDDRGFGVLDETLDAEGNRVIAQDGSAGHRSGHDAHGAMLFSEAIDTSGAPTTVDTGCARIDFKLDERGQRREVRCFDPAGKPTTAHEFGALERETRDERGLYTGWADFDAEGQPLADETGAASERRKFDRMRRIVEDTYFGVDGKPVVGTRGYAIERDVFDDDDDLVAVSYFDGSGQPTMYKGEYATRRMKHDERGLVVEEAYVDGQGEPTLCKDGYATVKRTRDRNGDVTREDYVGKRGEPIAREGGYAASTTTYDAHRLAIEKALLGADGQPVVGAAGWATERRTYDERGLLTRIDHFDAARKPVLDKDGRASLRKTNDARGNVTVEESLGSNGEPIVTGDGYATKRNVYDDRDELVEESLFGANGAAVIGKDGWSVRRVRFDDFGNAIEEALFDASHHPVAPKEQSYASKRQRFDDRRHLVEVAYFDPSGTPVKGPEGTAVVRYVRDTYGNATQTSYFDGAGAPAASKDGVLVARSKYDGASRLVEERFSDAAGAPRPTNDGCAGHATRYDQGRKVEESCLDVKDGAVTLSTDGWAIRRTLHDVRGNDVEVSTHAADGSLRPDKDGVARKRNRFDERNLLLETTYFDAADKPTRDKHGTHSVRYEYDDARKKTHEASYDLAGVALPAAKPPPR